MSESAPRAITLHQVSPLDNALSLHVLDEPGHGGGCHEYFISGLAGLLPVPAGLQAIQALKGEGYGIRIPFQNGPVQEAGVNGVSHEVLIAILIDRLQGFQNGPYASADNEEAMIHLEGALEALQRRTRNRLERGVEGTSQA